MSNGKLMLLEYRCSYLNCIFHFQKKMSEQIDLISNSKLNDCFNQTVKKDVTIVILLSQSRQYKTERGVDLTFVVNSCTGTPDKKTLNSNFTINVTPF